MFAVALAALTLASGAVCCSPHEPLLAPANPGVILNIVQDNGNILAIIRSPTPDFVGAVLFSKSDQLSYYLVDLPPLLTDGVMLMIGSSEVTTLKLFLPQTLPAIPVYAQAVVYDGKAFASSDVVLVEPPTMPIDQAK